MGLYKLCTRFTHLIVLNPDSLGKSWMCEL